MHFYNNYIMSVVQVVLALCEVVRSNSPQCHCFVCQWSAFCPNQRMCNYLNESQLSEILERKDLETSRDSLGLQISRGGPEQRFCLNQNKNVEKFLIVLKLKKGVQWTHQCTTVRLQNARWLQKMRLVSGKLYIGTWNLWRAWCTWWLGRIQTLCCRW